MALCNGLLSKMPFLQFSMIAQQLWQSAVKTKVIGSTPCLGNHSLKGVNCKIACMLKFRLTLKNPFSPNLSEASTMTTLISPVMVWTCHGGLVTTASCDGSFYSWQSQMGQNAKTPMHLALEATQVVEFNPGSRTMVCLIVTSWFWHVKPRNSILVLLQRNETHKLSTRSTIKASLC